MVTNFRWVVPDQLAVGARPEDDADARELIESGIRAVLSLEAPGTSARERFDADGIESLFLPVETSGVPSAAQLERGLHFIDQAVNAFRPLLIHGLKGEGRAPSLAAAWLIRQGWTADDALQAVRGIQSPEQLAFVKAFSTSA